MFELYNSGNLNINGKEEDCREKNSDNLHCFRIVSVTNLREEFEVMQKNGWL